MSTAQFSTASEPVSIYLIDATFKKVNQAVLKKTDNTVVESVEVLDFANDSDLVTWVAFFDPGSFENNVSYKIDWVGIDLNGASYTKAETGISVSYTDSVFAPLVKFLRQSIFDDGVASDYPPAAFLNAIKISVSKINSYPPLTSYALEIIPFDLLIDYARIELYRAKMAREALETFQYSDIGKSFSIDRSTKLKMLIDDIESRLSEKIKLFKTNNSVHFRGMYSRAASRTSTSVRGKHISQIIYRNFGT